MQPYPTAQSMNSLVSCQLRGDSSPGEAPEGSSAWRQNPRVPKGISQAQQITALLTDS